MNLRRRLIDEETCPILVKVKEIRKVSSRPKFKCHRNTFTNLFQSFNQEGILRETFNILINCDKSKIKVSLFR